MKWLTGWLRPGKPRVVSAPLGAGWFERFLSDTHFLGRYPQFAGVLARMQPVATNTVPIMAVALWHWDDPGSRLQLFVNVEYFEKHPEYRAGVLLHEIHHVLLGHLTNLDFHSVRHPKLMELAMELSADEFIPESMPDNGLNLEAFARFGIRPRQGTLERYRLLATAYERGKLRIQDWWFEKMRDTHRPRQEGACRGAGIGDLIDGRGDGADERNWNRKHGGSGAPEHASELARMKVLIARHLRGERGGFDDRTSDPTQRRIAKELQRVVRGTGQGWLDWRRLVRECFPRRRSIRPDYLRPNRRFTDRVGEIPGRSRRPPKPALWVGIDTSGSMSGSSLDQIAREIEHLACHARLTIIECDAAVHRVYAIPEFLGPFVGGGDTDFTPVFEETLGGRDYDGIVYFTDGKGDMPKVTPLIPTLWVLTHDDPFHADFGTIVRMGRS